MPTPSLDEAAAARMLAALGSVVRLRVYKVLLRAGPEGLNVSDLQRETAMPASTLAHHLATLVEAGLVEQERRGRERVCTARYDEIRKASAYLMAECCASARSRARAAA
jgi:ArsR family transcriptional regulator